MKEYIMELIGTMFLVLSIALTGNPLAIGMMLMAIVYIGGNISGAHYNPAVTLAVWMRGKLESKKIFGYMVSQLAGAFAGSLIYHSLSGKTLVISAGSGVALWQSVLVEALFTFVLCSVILQVATSKKFEGNHIYGLAIGLTLAACAFAGGSISGGVYNPAVGLGAAIMNSFAGSQNWAKVIQYLIGPFAGGILSAWIFNYMEL